MDKTTLRNKYKALRNTLTSDEIENLSISIANQSLKLPIWDKIYYHLFLPIEEKKEVNTLYLLQILQGKDKEILIPKTDFKTNEMVHVLLTDNTKIKKNNYGIPEPLNGIEVPEKNIEVVFVPLLAFDNFGNRVGYGKGFYDTFLSKCNSNTIKIGLSFFESEEIIKDVYDSDITLDYCITPEKIYTF